LQTLAEALPGVEDCHQVTVRQVRDKLFVSLHCRFDESLSLDEIHALSTQIENLLKGEIAALERVLVHAEPSSPYPPAPVDSE